jgi:hypothetical protein
MQHHSYLLYITFIRTFTSFIDMSYSHFHFFGSSWQAGCPRSLVSDTLPSAGLPRVDISSPQAPWSCSHAADDIGPSAHRTRLPAGDVLLSHSHLALSSLKLTAAGLGGQLCPQLPSSPMLVLASLYSLTTSIGQALEIRTGRPGCLPNQEWPETRTA